MAVYLFCVSAGSQLVVHVAAAGPASPSPLPVWNGAFHRALHARPCCQVPASKDRVLMWLRATYLPLGVRVCVWGQSRGCWWTVTLTEGMETHALSELSDS